METIYEGTWDEVAAHRGEFENRRLRVVVLDTSEETAIRERVARIERGLAMAREASRGLGPFPKREITLDVLYPDEDAPR